MSSEDTPMSGQVPTPSFRIEEGVLIRSVAGMAEKRIPLAEVSGWVRKLGGDGPTFHLMIKGGTPIDLKDPNGELERVLSTVSNFFSLDDVLKSVGPFHEDERLGRFVLSCGGWRLSATVDLPFQADVPISFELELDTPEFPKSMLTNVLWIQNNLGDLWNAAARVINTLVETEGIRPPERFALRHLWAHIPDAGLDAAQWKFTVEVKDMSESFEVVFRGMAPVGCEVA